MDAPRLARYPFLPEARELVRAEGPPLGELLDKRAWDQARRGGKERVMAALDGDAVPEPPVAGDHEALLALLGYAVARLLVSSVDDRLLVNRYATAESRRLGQTLAQDTDTALFETAEALGVPAEHRAEEDVFAIAFTDYLQATPELNAIEWKLVNRVLDDGKVLLARPTLIRLVQEAYRLRLTRELPLDVPREVPDALAPLPEQINARIGELREDHGDLEFGEVETDAFPPCINNIIADIKAGKNVSHEGRFAVVSFLNTVGMDRDAIINELFPNVPDFAKEITEYQVDHITGKKGKEAYTPPGCSSLQTYGLCPMLSRAAEDWHKWCRHEKMNHPLTFYRWGMFVKQKGSGDRGEHDEPEDDDATGTQEEPAAEGRTTSAG